ncbi:MAG: acylphosphatase [Gammaproteobacteria bacterium]|nr:acylphosphatase [Gammaproteobacteria bacterium]
MQTLTGLIKGRVQGVFFRAETQRMAKQLGLTGWCRNTVDGHVEVLICGEEKSLSVMRDWLGEGPELARVDAVELDYCENPDMDDFEIRY